MQRSKIFVAADQPSTGVAQLHSVAEADHLWPRRDIFEYEKGIRHVYQFLYQKMVADVLDQFVRHEDKAIVEVKSDAVVFNGTINQWAAAGGISVRSVNISKSGRKMDLALKRMSGTLVQERLLPTQLSQVDVIAGHSIFDTIAQPDEMALEIKNTLAEGGKFIHLLDLQPSVRQVFKEYGKKGEIVFPYPFIDATLIDQDNISQVYTFCSASKEDMVQALGRMKKNIHLKRDIKKYIDNPWVEYKRWSRDLPNMLRTMVLEVNRLGVLFPPINLERYFQDKMERLFDKKYFEILKNEVITEKEMVRRKGELGSLSGQYNSFKHRMGLVLEFQDIGIPEDMVELETSMHVFVAKKKTSQIEVSDNY